MLIVDTFPGQSTGVMTTFAVYGESGTNMARVIGIGKIITMASLALGRRGGELITFLALMACLAIGHGVYAGQRESFLRV